MKTVIIVLVIVGALAFGALNYHFILFDSSLKVLKKTEMTLEDTFVDARGTKKLKLLAKPALLKAGFRDLMEKEGFAIPE